MRNKYRAKRELIILSKLLHLPWLFIITLVLIACVGFAGLYSAAKGEVDPWASAQMTKFAVGFVLMLVVAIIDMRFWFQYAYLGYFFGFMLLIAVMFIGVEGGLGAQRWLRIGGFTFQPSEIMKVMLVISLARYFHNIHNNNITRIIALIIPAILIAVAAILILQQPNLGTAVIVTIMACAMMFMAGIGWKKFVIAGLMVLAFLPIGWNLMHDYQKQRVHTFINPESDPLGAGYNIIQSKIAIGSGGLTGKGFLQGSQSQLSFVPERQTDFIFSIIAEEFGFIGSMVVLLLYAILILLGLYISARSISIFGKLLAYGVIAVMFVHVFVNLGMVSGILPVVGVPLPLISYGGSSLISTLVGLGFVLNAHVHRNVKI